MFKPSFHPADSQHLFDARRIARSPFHGRPPGADTLQPQSAGGHESVGERDISAAAAVEKALQSRGIPVTGLNAEAYRPLQVAERIMASVQRAFGEYRQTAEDMDSERFFSGIRDGLEQGFEEAKSILQGLGVYQHQVADDLEHTRDLTFNALEDFSSIHTEDESSVGYQAQHAESVRTAEFQVRTREGDVVTLSFSQQSSHSVQAFQFEEPGVRFSAVDRAASAQTRLDVEIQGELSEEERDAIDELARSMGKVSHAFFNGNFRSALHHVTKSGFDPAQLSGFSLELSAQHSFRSVAAYQQTGNPQHAVNPDLLHQAAGFMNTAGDFVTSAPLALQTLSAPQAAFTGLFDTVASLAADMKAADGSDDADRELFAAVIDNLKNRTFAGEEPESVAAENLHAA